MGGAHVEVIGDGERLAPSLGGTGYLPPARAASRADLLADLNRTEGGRDTLGCTVWKVKRKSVGWSANPWPGFERRVHVGTNRIACTVIGGNKDWWFISVKIDAAKRLLMKEEARDGNRSV